MHTYLYTISMYAFIHTYNVLGKFMLLFFLCGNARSEVDSICDLPPILSLYKVDCWKTHREYIMRSTFVHLFYLIL